jgi:surface antigen
MTALLTTSDIKQINHTYPFGIDMEGNWNGSFMGSGTQGNAYKYNGKEFNNDYGLNRHPQYGFSKQQHLVLS